MVAESSTPFTIGLSPTIRVAIIVIVYIFGIIENGMDLVKMLKGESLEQATGHCKQVQLLRKFGMICIYACLHVLIIIGVLLEDPSLMSPVIMLRRGVLIIEVLLAVISLLMNPETPIATKGIILAGYWLFTNLLISHQNSLVIEAAYQAGGSFCGLSHFF